MEAVRILGEAAIGLGSLGFRYTVAGMVALAAANVAKLANPGVLAKLALPEGLTVHFYAGMLEDVVRNVLHVYFYKDYELLPNFKPKPGWSVMDAGAFVGLYAMRAARLVGERGLVVAIEPLPENYRLLQLNVALNGLDNVRTLGACLLSRWGFAELLVPESPVNATLCPDYADECGGPLRRVKVRTVPLDAILRALRRVDLLKLDVECSELDVIGGSELLQPKRVGRIVVEVHLPHVKPHEVARALEERGYRVVVNLPDCAPNQAFVYAF